MNQTIALLGASSQIARDLIQTMAAAGRSGFLLYVRRLEATQEWVMEHGLAAHCKVLPFEAYGEIDHEVVINFVGVGDPRRAMEMGSSILEITQSFDDLALKNLAHHPQRRYVFLSSGAVYGNAFSEPATESTNASIPVNAITEQNWYAVAKLHAEVRHRTLTDRSIVDLRVFNYFSRTQDLSARFFISDIIRAIRNNEVLRVSADFIIRDFLHPQDFHQLIERVLAAPWVNDVLDCYTAAPVDKPSLLQAMQERFGLRYELIPGATAATVNATGSKTHYYSLNRKAETFGYAPRYSALSGVLQEAAALLD